MSVRAGRGGGLVGGFHGLVGGQGTEFCCRKIDDAWLTMVGSVAELPIWRVLASAISTAGKDSSPSPSHQHTCHWPSATLCVPGKKNHITRLCWAFFLIRSCLCLMDHQMDWPLEKMDQRTNQKKQMSGRPLIIILNNPATVFFRALMLRY